MVPTLSTFRSALPVFLIVAETSAFAPEDDGAKVTSSNDPRLLMKPTPGALGCAATTVNDAKAKTLCQSILWFSTAAVKSLAVRWWHHFFLLMFSPIEAKNAWTSRFPLIIPNGPIAVVVCIARLSEIRIQPIQ